VRSFIFLGWVVVAIAATVVVDSSEARGQSALSAAARDALAQARQAHGAGRLKEASDGYTRAYELTGDAELLFQLGEVNHQMGQGVAALRFYRTYLARDPRGKNRKAAERAADLLESNPSAPAPVIAAPAPVAPAPPPAPAAKPPPPVARPAPAAPLAPPPPPPPRAPVAAVPVAEPPPAATAPPPATVDLRADVTSTAAAPQGPPLPGGLAWAGVGATLALGAGAVITGLQASHRYDELRASCGRTPEGCAPADINQVKSRALVANVLWAATGVAALATGVVVVVNAREVGFAGAWSF
jgi:hypothetical protein